MKALLHYRSLTSLTVALALATSALGADPVGEVSTKMDARARLRDAVAREGERNLFDETYQFIFFATLEGLYRDGVSSADVEALLSKKKPDGGFLNFIYTCPICMPVEGAIRTYKERPRVDSLKVPNKQAMERTFGFGLPRETSDALRSEKASVRLGAVNGLVSGWISYRMDHSGLSEEQKTALIETLKKRREEGMQALHNFAAGANGPDGIKFFAAGYESEDECAVCNAALQMPLKLKEPAAK